MISLKFPQLFTFGTGDLKAMPRPPESTSYMSPETQRMNSGLAGNCSEQRRSLISFKCLKIQLLLMAGKTVSRMFTRPFCTTDKLFPLVLPTSSCRILLHLEKHHHFCHEMMTRNILKNFPWQLPILGGFDVKNMFGRKQAIMVQIWKNYQRAFYTSAVQAFSTTAFSGLRKRSGSEDLVLVENNKIKTNHKTQQTTKPHYIVCAWIKGYDWRQNIKEQKVVRMISEELSTVLKSLLLYMRAVGKRIVM